jgi:membrane protease YdiL (CAAX protease family)
MLLVGVAEEYVFRGYAFQSLWRGAGFWAAALITSGLFAGAHLSKPHENAVDIGMIFVLGVLLCLSVRITGSLWWAVGWHAAFDFGQFFLIGTRNGGQLPVGRLFDATFPGPAWITGGELGTEASYFMIPVTIATFVYVMVFLGRSRASSLPS